MRKNMVKMCDFVAIRVIYQQKISYNNNTKTEKG